ncbi:rod shape-determining protein [Helcococcus kunzii]|uniref:rod shape-determining protein n=1 Tax=Helcococcus kunzii TaxID=40091 RepID=UPI0024ADF91E|nr:rod shape-determining protein [Helcococcus kunzii]
MKLLNIFGANFAIDLGTENTLVYKENEGIILKEASVVAVDVRSGEVVSVGNSAEQMIGKSPDNIVIVRPLENGSISDFDITKILLKHCMEKSLAAINIIQPRVVITAPTGISDIEMRALEDACIYSGAREVYIIESSMADAIGNGHDINSTEGKLIVDFGAGNTEIAIISMNGIVISKNLRYGGDLLNEEIVNFIYSKYSISIGLSTAKELKEKIGTVGSLDDANPSMEVSGRDALSGMPVTIDVFSSDIKEAVMNKVKKFIDEIIYVLEKNPPELSRDILKNGIFITGGGSQLLGLDKLIQDTIGVKVSKSSTPLEDTVNGAGIVVCDLKKYKNSGK